MKPILQNALPDAQRGDLRLPGTMPCDADNWLLVDEAYAAQMDYRALLLNDRPEAVLCEAGAPGREVLEEALRILPKLGFSVSDTSVTCPDARVILIDRKAPLRTLGHLVQEDICILEKRGDKHVLTGAVLCFPANWRLAEKINRPLIAIHQPVPQYDDNIARRVQRLFDGVRVGNPMWRFNRLSYSDADLHQLYKKVDGDQTPFVRSERQCILRLPRTDAVVFTIHTYVVQAPGHS